MNTIARYMSKTQNAFTHHSSDNIYHLSSKQYEFLFSSPPSLTDSGVVEDAEVVLVLLADTTRGDTAIVPHHFRCPLLDLHPHHGAQVTFTSVSLVLVPVRASQHAYAQRHLDSERGSDVVYVVSIVESIINSRIVCHIW